MKNYEIISTSAEQTRKLGAVLADFLSEGSLLTLSGDLGAGKTTFTQGLAKGLGVEKNVTSPTFTLMKSYQGRLPLYHIDAYRLEDTIQDLGFDEYLEGDGVCVVEWANFIEYVLPPEYLSISIEIDDDDNRIIRFTAEGEKYREVLDKLCTRLA